MESDGSNLHGGCVTYCCSNMLCTSLLHACTHARTHTNAIKSPMLDTKSSTFPSAAQNQTDAWCLN